MTRDALLDLARELDEVRGHPGLSTERLVRDLAARVDAGLIAEDIDIDPDARVPCWLVREVPRLLASWGKA
jgi:hypothetical protein